MSSSIRFLLVGVLVALQNELATAVRKDQHDFRQGMLSVTSNKQLADKCDQSSIFKVIVNKVVELDPFKSGDHRRGWTALFEEMKKEENAEEISYRENGISKAEMADYFTQQGLDCNADPDAVQFFFDRFAAKDVIERSEWSDAFDTLNRGDEIDEDLLKAGFTTKACDANSVFTAIDPYWIKSAKWTALFDEMHSHDGIVSQTEVAGYFRTKGLDCNAGALQFFFDKFDTNKDGSIEQSEWNNAWKLLLEADKQNSNNGNINKEDWDVAFGNSKPSDSKDSKPSKSRTVRFPVSISAVGVLFGCLCFHV